MNPVALINPRRSCRIVWNSAAKNTSGTDPNSPIDLEKNEDAPFQETEQPIVFEKGAERPQTSSKKDKIERKVEEKREKGDAKATGGEKGDAVVSSKCKHSQGTKRKQQDMAYHFKNKCQLCHPYRPHLTYQTLNPSFTQSKKLLHLNLHTFPPFLE